MEAANTPLDIEEILHLAAYAIDHQQPDRALALAKKGVDQYPESGEITYLLGALYAEIGMYDKATELLTKALSTLNDPNPAAFQLGLLHITSGQTDNAVQVWKQLDHLDEGHYFKQFSRGMLSIANDEPTAGAELIRQGIQVNKDIPALNRDMEKVIDKINHTSPTREAEGVDEAHSHFLLSGYAGRKKP